MRCKKQYFYSCFLILSLLVVVVFSESQALTNYGVVIPFVKFNQTFLMIGVLILFFFVLLLFNGRIKYDIICVFLVMRVLLCFIPMIYIDVPSSYFGNLVVSSFPLFIYLLAKNFRFSEKVVIIIFSIFGVIISLQCILAYYKIISQGLAKYTDPFYKTYFVIPVGATNNISAVLLPLLIIGFMNIKKLFLRYSYLALLLVAVYLTKSRTGLILSVLFLLCYFLFIKKYKSSLGRIGFIIAAVAVVGIFLALNNSFIFDYLAKLFKGFSKDGGNADSIFSGRLSLFGRVFTFFCEHPFFGNGVWYEQLGLKRSHNLILGALYENGAIGLINLLFFLFFSFWFLLKKRHIPVYQSFIATFIFIIINAMVEESFYIFPIEIMYLTFIALSTKKENEYV